MGINNLSSRQPMYSPILMHTGIDNIAPGTIGLEIRNPYDTAMLVDELRLYAAQNAFCGIYQDGTRRIDGDQARFQIKLGRQELTDGFVPIFLCGATQDWACIAPRATTIAASVFPSPGPVDSETRQYIVQPFKMPKPMYVPINGHFSIICANTWSDWTAWSAYYNSVNLDFGVAIAARSLPADYVVPKSISVPYIAKYLTDIFPTNTVNAFSSSEVDLKNPFDVPLMVDSVIASVVTVGSASGTGLLGSQVGITQAYAIDAGLNGFMTTAMPNYGLAPDFWTRALTLQLYNHDGHIVQRDPVPLGSLISPAHRSWKVNAVLPPRSYMTAYGGVLASGLDTLGAVRLEISIIGHREVPLTDLGIAK